MKRVASTVKTARKSRVGLLNRRTEACRVSPSRGAHHRHYRAGLPIRVLNRGSAGRPFAALSQQPAADGEVGGRDAAYGRGVLCRHHARATIGTGAVLMLTRWIKPQRIYQEIDRPLPMMFVGLFIVVAGL
jgi:hypothetical protein